MFHKEKIKKDDLLMIIGVLLTLGISVVTLFSYFRDESFDRGNNSFSTVSSNDNIDEESVKSVIKEYDNDVIAGGLTTFLARGESIPQTIISEQSIYEVPVIEIKELENGSLKKVNGNLKAQKIYRLAEKDIDLSTFSISWLNGELYIGSKPDDLMPVERSIDPDEFREDILSILYYNESSEIYLLSSKDTSISIDSYNSSILPSDKLVASKPSDFVNRDSGAKYSELPIISRDTWGANTYSWDPYSSSDIDNSSRFTWQPGYYRASRIVVHHTATNNTYPDPSKAVRDIYLYHTYSQGWGDIGYNYLIDDRGNIYEGKAGGDEVFGYHALTEANTMSVGISLIGNFDNYSPTQAQLDSLAKLIAEKSLLYGIPINRGNGTYQDWMDTNKTLFTDRDVWFWCYEGHQYDNLCPSPPSWARRATACPGQNLQNVMDSTVVPWARFYAEVSFQKIREATATVDNALAGTSPNLRKFLVEYNLPEDVPKSQLEAKIPGYSGILDYQINRNQLIIEVGDWDDNILVPYVGWDGQAPGVFFPPSGGPKDRVRTLMKLFLLDPDVKSVGVEKAYKITD